MKQYKFYNEMHSTYILCNLCKIQRRKNYLNGSKNIDDATTNLFLKLLIYYSLSVLLFFYFPPSVRYRKCIKSEHTIFFFLYTYVTV